MRIIIPCFLEKMGKYFERGLTIAYFSPHRRVSCSKCYLESSQQILRNENATLMEKIAFIQAVDLMNDIRDAHGNPVSIDYILGKLPSVKKITYWNKCYSNQLLEKLNSIKKDGSGRGPLFRLPQISCRLESINFVKENLLYLLNNYHSGYRCHYRCRTPFRSMDSIREQDPLQHGTLRRTQKVIAIHKVFFIFVWCSIWLKPYPEILKNDV